MRVEVLAEGLDWSRSEAIAKRYRRGLPLLIAFIQDEQL